MLFAAVNQVESGMHALRERSLAEPKPSNASCTARRSSQVVQNQRILVQTRPPRPWGVVNKTQAKEEQTFVDSTP